MVNKHNMKVLQTAITSVLVACIFLVSPTFATGYARIGNRVWEDTNNNGVRDVGEPYLSNVTLKLYRDNGDKVFNLDIDSYLATQVTGSQGSYYFEGLSAGGYWISVIEATIPFPDYVLTTKNEPYYSLLSDGEFDGKAVFGYYNKELPPTATPVPTSPATSTPVPTLSFTPVPPTATTYAAQVTASAVSGTVTGGASPVLTSTSIAQATVVVPQGGITGNIWRDSNCNGALDTGESGYGSVLVLVYRHTSAGDFDASKDSLVDGQYSPANGDFSFSHLAAGTYYVTLQDSVIKDNRFSTKALPLRVDVTASNALLQVPIGICTAVSGSVDLVLTASETDKDTLPFGTEVTFTLAYKNTSTSSAPEFTLVAPILSGTYTVGSLVFNGKGLTDANDQDAGYYNSSERQIEIKTGVLPANSEGNVSFKVKLSSLKDGKYLFEQTVYRRNNGVSDPSNTLMFALNPFSFILSRVDSSSGAVKAGEILSWKIALKSLDTSEKSKVLVGCTLPDSLSLIDGSLTG